METSDYWLTVAVLSALAVGAFVYIWNRWRRARLIDDVPTARIRSAAQGYTELHGRALKIDDLPMASPLTGRHCLWFRYKIEQSTHDHRGRLTWRTVHSGRSAQPILLDDGSGRCLIDPDAAEVTSDHKRIWYGNSEWPSTRPPNTAPSRWHWVLGHAHNYRYSEELLLEGDLYALGWFRTGREGQTSVDNQVRDTLRAWKADPATLAARFDRDGDGQVDMNEWDAARSAARQEVLERQVMQPAAVPTHTLHAPPDKTLPFLISDHPPRRLMQRYRRQAALSVLVFTASSLALLWLLGQRA